MVRRVLRVGVDLGAFLENEARPLAKLDHIALKHIAVAGAGVLIHRGRQPVLHHAQHAARLQCPESVGENLVGEMVRHPVVHIAEGQHHICRTIGRHARAGRRDNRERDVAVDFGLGEIGSRVGVDIATRIVRRGRIKVGRIELAASLFQPGPEDGGVPAAAGRDFDHRVRSLQPKEIQRLHRMAPLVARFLGRQAPFARDSPFQRPGSRVGPRGRRLAIGAGGRRRGLSATSGHKARQNGRQQQMSGFHVVFPVTGAPCAGNDFIHLASLDHRGRHSQFEGRGAADAGLGGQGADHLVAPRMALERQPPRAPLRPPVA